MAGNSIRLVKNEAHLWFEIYDNNWTEIFDIQTDIAKKTADNLETILSPEETYQILNVSIQNQEASKELRTSEEDSWGMSKLWGT